MILSSPIINTFTQIKGLLMKKLMFCLISMATLHAAYGMQSSENTKKEKLLWTVRCYETSINGTNVRISEDHLHNRKGFKDMQNVTIVGAIEQDRLLGLNSQ